MEPICSLGVKSTPSLLPEGFQLSAKYSPYPPTFGSGVVVAPDGSVGSIGSSGVTGLTGTVSFPLL